MFNHVIEIEDSDWYDTHCPTCDASEPTHTPTCAVVHGSTESEEESGQRSGECEHGDHAVCDGTTPGWPCECSCHESSDRVPGVSE